MKHINIYFIALSIAMLVLVGCSDSNTITGPAKDNAQAAPYMEDVFSIKLADSPKAVTFPIMTDRDEMVGTIAVQSDKKYIYITYSAMKNWSFVETNVHVAANVNQIPQTRDGYPSPNQYAYLESFTSEVKAYTTKIEISNHNFRIGQEIIIAANFKTTNHAISEGKNRLVTAWGGTKTGPGPIWWNYIPYILMEDKNNGDGGNMDNVIVLDKTTTEVIE